MGDGAARCFAPPFSPFASKTGCSENRTWIIFDWLLPKTHRVDTWVFLLVDLLGWYLKENQKRTIHSKVPSSLRHHLLPKTGDRTEGPVSHSPRGRVVSLYINLLCQNGSARIASKEIFPTVAFFSASVWNSESAAWLSRHTCFGRCQALTNSTEETQAASKSQGLRQSK